MSMSDPPFSTLVHIPGSDGWPLIGNTLQLLADPKGTVERFAQQYGPVYRSYSFGGRTVSPSVGEQFRCAVPTPMNLFCWIKQNPFPRSTVGNASSASCSRAV